VKKLMVAAIAVACLSAVNVQPVGAAARSFKNCTALHKSYPGGVARPGGHQKPGQPKLKKKPYVNAALYKANSSLDRDKDGIACEVS
jgi:excalibur calcium-binding domain-containing protein